MPIHEGYNPDLTDARKRFWQIKEYIDATPRPTILKDVLTDQGWRDNHIRDLLKLVELQVSALEVTRDALRMILKTGGAFDVPEVLKQVELALWLTDC